MVSGRRWAALLALGILLAGCAPSIATRTLGFSVARDANDRSPVPIELVVVYDAGLLSTLLELSAREWFEAREQLLLDHPQGLRTRLHELVPGQEVPVHPLPLPRRGAIAALVYADYLTPGPHRLRIDPYARVHLLLSRESVSVLPER